MKRQLKLTAMGIVHSLRATRSARLRKLRSEMSVFALVPLRGGRPRSARGKNFCWAGVLLAGALALSFGHWRAQADGRSPHVLSRTATRAAATTIIVDSTADGRLDVLAANATCDLREAIEAANTNQAVGQCPAGMAGADTLTFAPTVTGTIGLTGPDELALSEAVTITGPGANVLTVSGLGRLRVLRVNSGVTASISGLTITGGNGAGASSGRGGGILNQGNLTLTASHVTGNTVSTFAAGGGIRNASGGTLTIERSAVTNNTVTSSSSAGGGIDSQGTLIVTNSTVSGNRAVGPIGGNSGGIFSEGTTTITASTITDNEGGGPNSAGGVRAHRGTVTVRNTIIAANRNNTPVPDVNVFVGSFTSQGYNLIGNLGTEAAFNQMGDQVGTMAAPLNPLLGSLTNNGGPTPTHLPLAGSPAIDQGNSFGLMDDQRGFLRPVNDPAILPATNGDNSDIGAVEVQGAANTAPSLGNYPNATVNVGGNTIVTPASPPADDGVISSVTVLAPGFTGTATVDATTGAVSLSNAGPAGSFTVSVTVTDNHNAQTTRSFTLMVCGYSITPKSQSFTAAGGPGSVSLNAGTGCTWLATTSAPWISFSGGAGGSTSGAGSGTLNYTVAPNTSSTPRSADILVAGLVLTVQQAAFDNVPPTVTCPTAQTAVSNNRPLAVNYPPPTAQDNLPGTTVTCVPPAGARFPVGVTTVSCTARDASGNSSACSFTVTVRGPRAATKDLITKVKALVPPLNRGQVNGLIHHLEMANTRLEQGRTGQACTHLRNFVNQVQAFVSGRQLTQAQGQSLTTYANQIGNALGCAGSALQRAETEGRAVGRAWRSGLNGLSCHHHNSSSFSVL